MPLTSMKERLREICRDKPVRRLRRLDLAHDGRRMAGYDRAAAGRESLSPPQLCLASGSVHFFCIHHRSLILDPDRGASRLIMTVTEVTSKISERPGDRKRNSS